MEKIDFVLTWVDGSDPDWLAQRREYQPGRGTDAGESRYRDWDNLSTGSAVWRNLLPG